MSLIVKDPEYLKDVEVFVMTRPYAVRDSFYYNLSYLEDYGREDWDTYLYKDNSPYSFYFEVRDKEGNRILNGGMTYYGEGESGVSSPQFSVRVGGKGEEEWRINT